MGEKAEGPPLVLSVHAVQRFAQRFGLRPLAALRKAQAMADEAEYAGVGATPQLHYVRHADGWLLLDYFQDRIVVVSVFPPEWVLVRDSSDGHHYAVGPEDRPAEPGSLDALRRRFGGRP